jgi:hypothetical protein
MAWLWFAALTNKGFLENKQVPISDLPESSPDPERWTCNHSERNEDSKRDPCMPPFSYQTIGTGEPKKLESFQESHSRVGKGQGPGARQRRTWLPQIFHIVPTTYQATFQEKLEPRQWLWTRPHFNHECLVMYTFCPPFEPNLHDRALKLDPRGSLDLCCSHHVHIAANLLCLLVEVIFSLVGFLEG